MEQWKDIPGYEGYYEASSIGGIRSKRRLIIRSDGKKITLKRKKLKFHLQRYLGVKIYKNGIPKNFKVHRLVALTFIPNPENKPQINHLNGIKIDNGVDNLEWVTQSENMLHAYKTGLKKPKKGYTIGEEGRANMSRAQKESYKNGRIVWHKGKTIKPITHGTQSGYIRKCKCDKCAQANANYVREWRRKFKLKTKSK